ncbi:hypothetical protein X801_00943, partial [Opisthorchis viverrini]
GKGSCLGRVPYNSVIGFILVFVGGGVLCGSLHYGMSKLDVYFRHNFFPVYSLQYLRITAVVFGALAIWLALLVVIFSVLVTNATRGRIYRGDRFTMGGRVSAVMYLSDIYSHSTATLTLHQFMTITYVAVVVWLVFLVFLVVPTFCWIMFNSICATELADVWHGPGARRPGPDGRVAPTFEELRRRNEIVEDTYVSRLAYYYPGTAGRSGVGFLPPDLERRRYELPLVDERGVPYSPGPYSSRIYSPGFRYVFNLTNYGIYVKPWQYDSSLNYREAITSLEGFAAFCDEVALIGPLFACSLGGAIFVLMGLTLFIGSLSGFYARLKLTKELTDFKQSFALRSPKTHDHAVYF